MKVPSISRTPNCNGIACYGVREMAEEEIRKLGDARPTIDHIEVGEFTSHAELTQWLGKHAPAFLPGG